MKSQSFAPAPWNWMVWVATGFVYVWMPGLVAIGLLTGPRHLLIWNLAMVGLPVVLMVIPPFFMIRGYRLEDGLLRVRRLGWSSTVSLEGMSTVAYDPDAMRGAIRLFGNGGLFCVTGLHRNATLGNFRAFLTNPKYAVVLHTNDGTYVVSPDGPDDFVDALSETRSPQEAV